MKTSAQKKLEQHEVSVVEGMKHARELAVTHFGPDQADTNAVQEIYDYLQQAEEDEFIADLVKAIGSAKEIYNVAAPTSQQVFGVFERIFLSDED